MSVDLIIRGRRQRQRRRLLVTAGLGVAVVIVFIASLMIGNTFYGLLDVAQVIVGDDVPGASFTVGQLRLPRVTLGMLAGLAFGIAGVTAGGCFW